MGELALRDIADYPRETIAVRIRGFGSWATTLKLRSVWRHRLTHQDFFLVQPQAVGRYGRVDR